MDAWQEQYRHEQAVIHGWLLHREALLNGHSTMMDDYRAWLDMQETYRLMEAF